MLPRQRGPAGAQARPQVHTPLEHRVAYVEELVRDEQAQLVQFSSDINAAFRHLDETRLPDLEAGAVQQQEELRQLRAQQQQLLEGLAPAGSLAQLAAELAALRSEHASLRRDHEALRQEHGALRDCLLGWAPVASEVRSRARAREGIAALRGALESSAVASGILGAAGDRGACLTRLAAGCRALRGCARRAAEGQRGRDLDESVWDALPAFEPTEAVLERWSGSDTVQGVLPGVRAKAVVGLSDSISFGDVHVVLQQLGLQLDHFVDTFARMPGAAGGRDEKELMAMADSIFRRFASKEHGADASVCGFPTRQRGTLSCRDLFRLLEVVGVSLKRFKSMVNGVEELEDEPSPALEQVGSYNLLRQLGSGSKGVCCWLGEHAVSEAKVAIKWPVKAAEMDVLRDLGRHAGGAPRMLGAPKLLDSGVHGSKQYVAMELLGSTLSKVFQSLAARPFRHRWRGVCAIGRMLVRRFQALHARGYVHCDVSPDNVLVGPGAPPAEGEDGPAPVGLYLVDFEHTRRYPDGAALEPGVGSVEWGSVRSAGGGAPLPEDDLEALGWVLLNGLFGSLPWNAWLQVAYRHGDSNLTRHQVNRQVRLAKMQILGGEGGALEHPWGRSPHGIPSELLRYIRACGVEVAEAGRPDYESLVELLGGSRDTSSSEEADLLDARLLAQILGQPL